MDCVLDAIFVQELNALKLPELVIVGAELEQVNE